MKFLLLAALIACAYAEPEAKPEADAYYAGAYGFGGLSPYRAYGGYPYRSYSYGYARPAYYGSYAHHGLFKRDAEAEPEADADAYYAGAYGFGGLSAYRGFGGFSAYNGYGAYPYRSYSYGYARPAYYGSYAHHGLYKRDAEAEPEADADAYYAGAYRFGGLSAYRGFGYPAYNSYAYGSYPYRSYYGYPRYSGYRYFH